MNYYIQGSPARAEEIKAAFGKFVSTQEMAEYDFSQEEYLFYTGQEERGTFVYAAWSDSVIAEIIKTHPDFQELELHVQPKFKVGDEIIWNGPKGSKPTEPVKIIQLIDKDQLYMVDMQNGVGYVAYDMQDYYKLVQKPHYDIKNFHAGMPVLVRPDNDCSWDYSVFSRNTGNEYWHFAVCNGVSFSQCIPFNDDTKHLLGTTDMCDEMYINW